MSNSKVKINGDNEVAMTTTKTLDKKDMAKMFVRSMFLLGSFNFERMQSVGFCVTLIPALKKLYKTILIERKLSMPYLKKIGIAFKDAILTPNAFKW